MKNPTIVELELNTSNWMRWADIPTGMWFIGNPKAIVGKPPNYSGAMGESLYVKTIDGSLFAPTGSRNYGVEHLDDHWMIDGYRPLHRVRIEAVPDLAKRFGLSNPCSVGQVIRGERWAHVDVEVLQKALNETQDALQAALQREAEAQQAREHWQAEAQNLIERCNKIAQISFRTGKERDTANDLLRRALPCVIDSMPKRGHEGGCGPESGCDAICMEVAAISEIARAISAHLSNKQL